MRRMILAMVLVSAVTTAAADPPPRLDAALRAVGLVATWTEHGDAIVTFEASDHAERESWPVTIRSVRNAEWVLVYATVLDGEPESAFNDGVLSHALRFNAGHAGCKFALDYERGDLDVQAEIPASAFSSAVLKAYIHDVVVTCDEQAPILDELWRTNDGEATGE